MGKLDLVLENMSFDYLKSIDLSTLTRVFFENTILSYIVGIVLIIVVFKILKYPLKIIKKVVVNSVFGYFILYILLMFKIVIVPFTYLNYFLVGSFGIFGIIIAYIIS